MKSVNNIVITKPYSGKRGIRQKVSSGFATVEQKTKLVGLEVLCDAVIIINNVSTDIKKGQIAYFTEEVLHATPWSNKILTCDLFEGQFIMADGNSIVVVV